MIDQETIQSAKNVDISLILDEFEWWENSAGLIRCPVPAHEDNNPSCSVNHNKNTCRCFVCDETFDTISLYRNLAKKVNRRTASFPDAVSEILELDENVTSRPAVPVPTQTYNKSFSGNTNFYNTILQNCKPVTGYELNYLHDRGIMLYDSYLYNEKVYTKQSVNKALNTVTDKNELQLLHDVANNGEFYSDIAPILKRNHIQIKHNWYRNTNYIIYQIEYEESNIPSDSFLADTDRHMLIKKSLNDTHVKRCIGESDFCWVADGLDPKQKEIYLCEGIEDAFSYAMNRKLSISLNSLSNLRSFMDYVESNSEKFMYKNIVLSFDHDQSG